MLAATTTTMMTSMAAMAVAVTTAALDIAPAVTQIASFATDAGSATSWKWAEVNDPVMGGVSHGTFTTSAVTGTATFKGSCKIVPKLKAPGFCNAETSNLLKTAPDVSAFVDGSLYIRARSSTNYSGFKLSLAADTINRQFASYKAPFSIAGNGQWQTVAIAVTSFSNDWSPFTGGCSTVDPTGKAHRCCNATYPDVCLKAKNLADISQIGLWAEGAEGDFDLEVAWIGAGPNSLPLAANRRGLAPTSGFSVGVADVATAERAADVAGKPHHHHKKDWTSVCSGPVEKRLLYNMSGRDNEGFGPTDETLADAICCDPNLKAYAEPSGTFAQPDVSLFTKIDATGITTFYDSVCGVPVFAAPKGRSFAEWHNESIGHGWPSFRTEEVNFKYVKVLNETGEVISSCGTHLGSYLPDGAGPRFCIDLVCIAGKPESAEY